MQLTWLEASKLNEGDRVVFVTSHDIFAENVIVPEGMLATVTTQGLNELATALYVTPDDEAIRTKLADWDGMIQLVPGLDREYGNRGHEWQALSPLARAPELIVNLYSVNQTTEAETIEACDVTLADCFPDDPQEIPAIEAQLNKDGEAYYGGGAAPLFKLVRVRVMKTWRDSCEDPISLATDGVL